MRRERPRLPRSQLASGAIPNAMAVTPSWDAGSPSLILTYVGALNSGNVGSPTAIPKGYASAGKTSYSDARAGAYPILTVASRQGIVHTADPTNITMVAARQSVFATIAVRGAYVSGSALCLTRVILLSQCRAGPS